MRSTARPDGGRRQGRGVPAPGRRLRRVVRRRGRRADPRQAQDAAPDGRRPHLRGLGARGEGRPDCRAVLQAALQADRDPRRRDPPGVPGRLRERLRLHRGQPHPGPRAAQADVPRLGVHVEPGARLHHRRLRRPAPGARLEPGLREDLALRPALRAAGPRDRQRAELHAGLRHRPGGVQDRRVLLLARGAAAGLRVGPDPGRLPHRQAVRRLRAHGVDRRAHPAAGPRAHRVRLEDPQPDRHQARPEHHGRGGADLHRPPRPRAGAGPADVHRPHGRRQDPRPAARAGGEGHGVRRDGGLGDRPDARQHLRGGLRAQDPPLRRRARRGQGLLRGAQGARHPPGRHPRRADRRRRHRVRGRRRRDLRRRPAPALRDGLRPAAQPQPVAGPGVPGRGDVPGPVRRLPELCWGADHMRSAPLALLRSRSGG
ncbi:2-keto-3-deoxy-D-arabino-heptulosonate-7-phosphate synthase II [Streptomyces misionensis JCM 4497]